MTTQTHEIEARLGDSLESLTAEQVQRLRVEADVIDARYPDPDQEEGREAALTAAAAYLLGDTTPEEAGRERRATQAARDRALAAAVQVAAMAAGDGMPDKTAARTCGIDRMTLLARLDKR